MLATFYGFERLGNRGTLLAACALNLGGGRSPPRSSPAGRARDRAVAGGREPRRGGRSRPAPRRFVLAACGIVGFAFFLLELVWYRMLSPLLGGSVFTFGLILATALLGHRRWAASPTRSWAATGRRRSSPSR